MFRQVQAAWEALRDLYTGKKVSSFSVESDYKVDADVVSSAMDVNAFSWAYYAEAESEEEPLYKVELARSDRSTCIKSKEKIAKGTRWNYCVDDAPV